MKNNAAKNPNKKILDKTETTEQANERKKSEAKLYNNPLLIGANIVRFMHNSSDIDFSSLYDDMHKQMEQLQNGDTSRIEAMLLSQAHALQAIFFKASGNLANSQYLNGMQAWGTLAMKAQNQCRQTLATLAEIRNPKPSATFIKQQNNAINQQVNNNAQSEISKNSEKQANELLSEADNAALDEKRAVETISVNKQMGTVEAINRG